MRRMLLGAALLLALPVAVQAQVSANANVSVNVIAALTLVNTGDLDFGVASIGQTATVAASSGDAGSFEASGQPGASIEVTFGNATLTRTGESETLTFVPALIGHNTNTQGSATSVANEGTVTLDATTGDYFFWLGGSVDTSGAVAGTYEGDFTLTVAYN